MRPRTLEEFVGQQHILKPGMLLRRAIEADRIQSLIFYGPPGTGKTTLAQIIANRTESKFVRLSGVESNVGEMRQVLAGAANRLDNTGRSTLLFIDEIHRFNKAQQDVLLPDVEGGTVKLVGATTHNPFFFVNSPLVSRSQIFELEPLEEADVLVLLERALADAERGIGHLKIKADPKAPGHLARISDGDARKALDLLRIAAEMAERDGSRQVTVDYVNRAESMMEQDQVRKVVLQLPLQHKAVLVAILANESQSRLDRQTTGGYATIATVISADLPVAGQLAPGDWIAFEVFQRRSVVPALTALEP